MAVKYHCPKCQKRFVDWGAQKLGYVCPECQGDLVLVGGSTGKTKSKPSLRRPIPAGEAAPRRVTSFDSIEEEGVKAPAASGEAEEEFDAGRDTGPADFDDDEGEIDLSAEDDEPAEVEESDD